MKLPQAVLDDAVNTSEQGWVTLKNVSTGAFEISGKAKFGLIGLPKFKISRITGMILVSESRFSLSRKCDNYHPSIEIKRF